MNYTLLLFTCLILSAALSTVSAQQKDDPWLEKLLRAQASPLLQKVLDNPDTFQYQIIYTRIDRDKQNRPQFKNHYLHVDRNRYFNPASTVKLPTALAALEKLNNLKKKGWTSIRPCSLIAPTVSKRRCLPIPLPKTGFRLWRII